MRFTAFTGSPIGFVASCLLMGMLAAVARAQEDSSVLLERPAEARAELPALLPPAQDVEAAPPVERPFLSPAPPSGPVLHGEPIPAPPVVAPAALPVSRIKYDSDRGARRMLAKFGGVDLVMITKNPRDGCLYEIPLCVPACCVGEPLVKSRRGLLKRGVVKYCWPCGFEVRVTFRHRGDVRVKYDT